MVETYVFTGENEMNNNVIDFLLDKSEIAIKYRVIRDLCENQNTNEFNMLQDELMHSERVIRLLACLKNHKEYHGASLYAVENSLNMLIDMGLQYGKGFKEFDDIVKSISDEAQNKMINNNHVLGYLSHIVVVPFLLRAGIREEWLIEFTKERIDIIYDFIIQKDYDIYDDLSTYKRIPKSFQNRPIIRPCLYKNGKIQFPLEYDIYGFASLMPELSMEYQGKINEVISYILDDKFGAIEDGYGILSDKKNYWAMGWDPKPTNLTREYQYNPLLLKVDLMSNFLSATNSLWFTQALELMEQYADENGLYHYPKNFLTEKDSCWILGNHMSLGENRRQKHSMIVEGTCRTLLILKKLTKIK